MRIRRNTRRYGKQRCIAVQKRAVYFGGIGILCLFLFGCHKEELVLSYEAETQVSTGAEEAEEAAFGAGAAESSEASGEASVLEEDGEAVPEYVIHICGAVVNSGVYRLTVGARIDDALQAAGGFSENADREYVNLARLLEDGMKITIPTKEQSKEWQQQGRTGLESETGAGTGDSAGQTFDGKVNINTADAEQLCTLPGIGESKAASIIAYRETNGPFQSPEDIMKVAGIKSAAYEKVKDHIVV